jgi:hypothetical protein
VKGLYSKVKPSKLTGSWLLLHIGGVNAIETMGSRTQVCYCHYLCGIVTDTRLH